MHGLLDVDHPRQHLVLDIDEVERGLGGAGRGRCHRRHGVAGVKRLVSRHDVTADVAQVLGPGGCRDIHREVDQVVAAHDGPDTFGPRGPLEVDGLDPGVRVGASEYLPPEHVRLREIRAEVRASRYLVFAVGPDRPLADPLVVALIRHDSPLLSRARSVVH